MRGGAPGGTRATVVGRVLRVRSRHNGSWRIRLADTGGALAAAEIRPSHPLPLPRVGARILLRGTLQYDEVHHWYAVDPVEIWIEPPLTLTPASALTQSRARRRRGPPRGPGAAM